MPPSRPIPGSVEEGHAAFSDGESEPGDFIYRADALLRMVDHQSPSRAAA